MFQSITRPHKSILPIEKTRRSLRVAYVLLHALVAELLLAAECVQLGQSARILAGPSTLSNLLTLAKAPQQTSGRATTTTAAATLI